MSKFKILQYRYFKYARWPHVAMTVQTTSQHADVLCWLKANLKESQYRINHSKAVWYFPNTSRQVGYHFKDSADLLALKLKFDLYAHL